MGKTVSMELDLTKGVPREIAESIAAGYENRPTDLGDMPLLTEEEIVEFGPPVDHFTGAPLAVNLDLATARFLYKQANKSNKTPSEVVCELVRKSLSAAAML